MQVEADLSVADAIVRLVQKSRPTASSVRQPLDMGAALAEFVLDAFEAAIKMIDTADHGLSLRRKAGNDERHRGAQVGRHDLCAE